MAEPIKELHAETEREPTLERVLPGARPLGVAAPSSLLSKRCLYIYSLLHAIMMVTETKSLKLKAATPPAARK